MVNFFSRKKTVVTVIDAVVTVTDANANIPVSDIKAQFLKSMQGKIQQLVPSMPYNDKLRIAESMFNSFNLFLEDRQETGKAVTLEHLANFINCKPDFGQYMKTYVSYEGSIGREENAKALGEHAAQFLTELLESDVHEHKAQPGR